MDQSRTETSAPRGVFSLFCPLGHVITETQDRRWLWQIQESLTNAANSEAGLSPELAAMSAALDRFLVDTCEHHWEDLSIDGRPGDEKCLWCEIPRPKGSWFGSNG